MTEKNTQAQLLEISELTQSIYDNINKITSMFHNEELQRTGTFVMLYDETLCKFLDKMKMVALSAKIEADTWNDIKNMTNEEKSFYFFSGAAAMQGSIDIDFDVD